MILATIDIYITQIMFYLLYIHILSITYNQIMDNYFGWRCNVWSILCILYIEKSSLSKNGESLERPTLSSHNFTSTVWTLTYNVPTWSWRKGSSTCVSDLFELTKFWPELYVYFFEVVFIGNPVTTVR